MVNFMIGLIVGGTFGIFLMSLLHISREEREDD